MRLIKQGPDPGLELLPPGHVIGEVSVLVAEFLGELLLSWFVRLNIKLKENLIVYNCQLKRYLESIKRKSNESYNRAWRLALSINHSM